MAKSVKVGFLGRFVLCSVSLARLLDVCQSRYVCMFAFVCMCVGGHFIFIAPCETSQRYLLRTRG